MNQIERRLRAAVNPLSTAVTGWWCHSALRRRLTGYGPTASQRRIIRQRQSLRRRTQVTGRPASAEQMQARARAIDELLARDGHEGST